MVRHILVEAEEVQLQCGADAIGARTSAGMAEYAGGIGWVWRGHSGHSDKYAGGGAGNPGGLGKVSVGQTIQSGINYGEGTGENGTGGLLIIFANKFENKSQIISNGSNGGKTVSSDHSTGGGASGGGSVNIFYKELINEGIVTANGGEGRYFRYKRRKWWKREHKINADRYVMHFII